MDATAAVNLPENWPIFLVPTLIGSVTLFACWFAVGRDPKLGTIHPEFEPPGGIGPAEARHLLERGYDDRCLAAAIANMAVKGALRIVDQPSKSAFKDIDIRLEPLGAAGKGLTPAESAAYVELFPTDLGLSIRSGRGDGTKITRAKSAMASWLRAQQHGRLFDNNIGWTVAGTGAGIAVAALFLPLVGRSAGEESSPFIMWLFPLLLLPMLWVVVYLLRLVAFSPAKEASPFINEALHLFVFAFGLIAFGYLLVKDLFGEEISNIDITALMSGALFAVIVVAFAILMRAPSARGRLLLDRLEGFALYLRMAEEERLKLFGHPKNTPERLERLRPYIIALGEPDAWTKEVVGVLDSAFETHWTRTGESFQIYDIDQSLIDAVRAAIENESRSSQRQRR